MFTVFIFTFTENQPQSDEIFLAEGDNPSDTTNTTAINTCTNEIEPDLDPNVLQILGDDPTTLNAHGDDINKHVAPRWQHILLNGLTKEVKAEMLTQYLIPGNCSNLKAPKLNPEMKAALSEINLKKDTFHENKQNQLSSCLTALGKVLDKALALNLNQDIIKPLSDAGRLLCDYHYRESQSRRFTILNSLNKDTRDAVKDTKIDEYLFGSELAEHLKSAKAISKSGSEMRTAPTPRPQFKPPAAALPQRGTLNSRGASRTAATEMRPAPYTTARRPAPPAQAYQQRDRGRRRDTANYRNYNRQRPQRR